MLLHCVLCRHSTPHSQQRPAQRIQHQPQPVLRELPAAKPTPKVATLPSPKRLIEEAASKQGEASPPKKAKIEIDVSLVGLQVVYFSFCPVSKCMVD